MVLAVEGAVRRMGVSRFTSVNKRQFPLFVLITVRPDENPASLFFYIPIVLFPPLAGRQSYLLANRTLLKRGLRL
jgi:hypothetical protein